MISQRNDLLDISSALKLHSARSRAPSPFPLRLLARWMSWVPAAVRWRGLYPPPADAPARQSCIFSPSSYPTARLRGHFVGRWLRGARQWGDVSFELTEFNYFASRVGSRPPGARRNCAASAGPPPRVFRPGGVPRPAFPGSPPLSRESGSRYAPFFLG